MVSSRSQLPVGELGLHNEGPFDLLVVKRELDSAENRVQHKGARKFLWATSFDLRSWLGAAPYVRGRR
uniref:Uncharacterized protein n=1 Tax=Streptomyces rochei TaxID=1928 RepID=A0A068Q7T4_STRRO|nr:hypothetical protein [Streptomyces rochei]